MEVVAAFRVLAAYPRSDFEPPPNCEVWGSSPSNVDHEINSIFRFADQYSPAGNMLLLDCGYNLHDGKDSLSFDPLSWYVWGQREYFHGASPKGLASMIVGNLCRRGGTASVSMCAVGRVTNPVVDLFKSFGSEQQHHNTDFPLVQVPITSAKDFGSVVGGVIASRIFQQYRAKVSICIFVADGKHEHFYCIILARQEHHGFFVKTLVHREVVNLNSEPTAIEPILQKFCSLLDVFDAVTHERKAIIPFVVARINSLNLSNDSLQLVTLISRLAVRSKPLLHFQEDQMQADQSPNCRGTMVLAEDISEAVESLRHEVQALRKDLNNELCASPPRVPPSAPQHVVAELHRLREQRSSSLAIHRELEHDIDVICQSLVESLEYHRGLRQKLSVSKAELESLIFRNNDLTTKLHHIASLSSSTRQEIQQASEELLSQDQFPIEHSRRMGQLIETRRNNEIKHKEEVRALLDSQKAEMETLSNQASRHHAAYQGRVTGAEQEALHLASALEANLKATTKEKNSVMGKLAEIEQQLRAKEETLQELDRQFRIRSSNLEEMKSKASAADAATSRLSTKKDTVFALQSDVGKLTAACHQLRQQLTAIHKRIEEHQSKPNNFRDRIAQDQATIHNRQLRVLEKTEAYERAEVMVLWMRGMTDLWKLHYKEKLNVPSVNLTADVATHLLLQESQRLAEAGKNIGLQRAEIERALGRLNEDLDFIMRSGANEIGTIQDETRAALSNIEQLRLTQCEKAASAEHELSLVAETHRRLFDEFLCHIHDETYSAIVHLNKEEERRGGASPLPRNPADFAANQTYSHPSADAFPDEVCRMYLHLVERLHKQKEIEGEAAKLRQAAISLESAVTGSADKLASERNLLGELEERLHEVQCEEIELERQFDALIAEQGAQRREMEEAIEQAHSEGQQNYRNALTDAQTAQAAVRALEGELHSMRFEANAISLQLEEEHPVYKLEQQLLDAKKANEALEEAIASMQAPHTTRPTPSARNRAPLTSPMPWQAASPSPAASPPPAAAGSSSPPPPTTDQRQRAKEIVGEITRMRAAPLPTS